MSPLQQITYRLLIQPSHLIEDTAWLLSIRIKWSRLRPVYTFMHFNQKQVVKIGAQYTGLSISIFSLALRSRSRCLASCSNWDEATGVTSTVLVS